MRNNFGPRYFRLQLKNGVVIYRKLQSIEGILADEVYANENHIVHLMTQDLQDEYGDCEVWVISKEEE